MPPPSTDLSSISERRVENLVNPDLSGLPGFLTPHPGLNSGMMLVQVLAAALVSENKALSFPASVDSIPTSANREDHVSMSTARRAQVPARSSTNATRVLACELLCAAQGLEFHRPLRPGRGVEAAYRHVREHVRPLGRDRTLHRDLEAVERLIRSGSLLAAVEDGVRRTGMRWRNRRKRRKLSWLTRAVRTDYDESRPGSLPHLGGVPDPAHPRPMRLGDISVGKGFPSMLQLGMTP